MDNEYPCIDCLFIITCDTSCSYAQKFDMSITKIKRTGKCPYCGSKLEYSILRKLLNDVTVGKCTVCRFSWII